MIKHDKDDYFILYSNCVPVKGAIRSVICDLQIGKYFYIPNDLFILLKESKRMKLNDLIEQYGVNNSEIINEYLEYLLENNLGFIDSEPELFPAMNLEWDYPSKVTNAIFDVNEKSLIKVNYKKAFRELSELNCHCLQIRFFSKIGYEKLNDLLTLSFDSRIKEIRLFLKFNKDDFESISTNFINEHSRITEIIFFDSGRDETEKIQGVNFTFSSNPNITSEDCGQICHSTFSINIPHFTESLKYNSCLNRKISLDEKGSIKNCPSHNVIYGNINEDSFEEVLNQQKFQHLWKLKKDDIAICKDCEFRYICTDCRVFLNDETNDLSKPLKCTYDPYSAKWN
ncbi:MAG: grasp-with-spasm system SPASM domain peptide maturase [Patiriisocius sp.]|uniref:grasp-with-spasm system SPASM domain peptide maturase n=1 Tax=Patiriisocius sp. TaxID=2822396 RepID=UPI003EFAB995